MLLTTQEEKVKRWEEHVSKIFNKDDSSIRSKQEIEDNSENETEVKLDPATKTEIQLALSRLKNGKAAGLDNIYLEVLKVDSEITAEMLYPLLEKIWKEEKIPEDWEEGLIIKIPKKGDLSNCNNWRGVTLVSIPSKILTRIILNRIHSGTTPSKRTSWILQTPKLR